MTKRRLAESLAWKLMAKHGLPDEWDFLWQTKKTSLGTCKYYRKQILLSEWFVDLNEMSEIEDTILHEIAHALAFIRHGAKGKGHGKIWKSICREIGARPERCGKQGIIREDKYKYREACQCGIEYKRHRIKKHVLYSCPKCKQPLFNDRRRVAWLLENYWKKSLKNCCLD